MSLVTALLATAAGKWIVGALAVFAALIASNVSGRLTGAKRERNAQKAKEADAYAKHIKDVEDAAYARDHVSGGVESDPRNRDRLGN